SVWPTEAQAQEAGMALDDFAAFVEGALFLDRPDPAGAWRELSDFQTGLVDRLKPAEELHIEADGTDLRLNVKGRTWINSDGRRNMPSGEIFTGPVEDSARGRLRCGFPVCRNGRELVGIELEFAPGARRLGELGLGLNRGIDRFTGSILYDEKIGGTVHLALGQSYPETGGTNESTLH